MRISVVVPTYKRLNDLTRCLTALDNQASLPYEVVVVVRLGDVETLSYIQNWAAEQALYSREFCVVPMPGQVQALIKGVGLACGDVVAFTDDDAVPDSTWVLKMQLHYQNQMVGGVGGRDIIVNYPEVPLQTNVGTLTWYGKVIGNHHLGYGSPRDVDVLKGVNMSFRKHLVEFSPFLRGSGAQAHNEVGLCLRIKRMGYSLVYDPTIIVHHYPARRIDSEQRTEFNSKSVKNAAFNMQMSLLTWLPLHQKLIRLLYSTLIGDKGLPGLMRFVAALLRWEVLVIRSCVPAQVGSLLALVHYYGWIFGLRRKISSPSSITGGSVERDYGRL